MMVPGPVLVSASFCSCEIILPSLAVRRWVALRSTHPTPVGCASLHPPYETKRSSRGAPIARRGDPGAAGWFLMWSRIELAHHRRPSFEFGRDEFRELPRIEQ